MHHPKYQNNTANYFSDDRQHNNNLKPEDDRVALEMFHRLRKYEFQTCKENFDKKV